ncbi:MAG: tRNA (N(6)-L-threonylcarbamoyladenosine(37)-C(2))-methylthiotransferase, partial [Candidatus Diapherotrites archaeon]|nr:tRNA (N(6)-L-threonylcarbamoyladenosine(37)-C(2))-methylthiotransferase [Candidatus Diapherotrites archaeon]
MSRVVFKTYGCSNNFSESEAMAGLLSREGHQTSEGNDFDQADVVIFNMCSVKGISVNQCIKELRSVKQKSPGKKVVIAGCVPRDLIPSLKKEFSDLSFVNTHHIDKINTVVSSDTPQEHTLFDRKVKLNLPKIRKNPLISIVPILSGCNDHCSYCSTILVKGPTFSYPKNLIVKEVTDSVRSGCKEIWLTSQDNGAYMTDHGFVGLPGLIERLNKVDGDFWIRVGMTNPTYMLDCLDEFIEAMQSSKVFKFLHLPVQSGNNDVLKRMKRRYTVEDFRLIIDTLKRKIPDITFSNDVICGFPGETDEQFQDTLNLIAETKP